MLRISTGEARKVVQQTASRQNGHHLVVFDLAGEGYGIGIATVREIIRMQPVTPVPHTPAFLAGVINLRGRITPVIDLRTRLGLPERETTGESRIVVVEIENQTVGMIVDAVTAVLRVPESSIEPPSSVIASGGPDYLVGIAKLESGLVLMPDLGRVLSNQELETLRELAAAA